MNLSGVFEIAFLLLGTLVVWLGTAHTKAFFRSNPTFSSHADLDRYQTYVAYQMRCSILFIAALVPAILCGIYFSWVTPGIEGYLPLVGYWIPFLMTRGTKRMEDILKSATVPPGELKQRYDVINFVWKKKLFPKF